MTVELSAGLSVDEYLDLGFDPECELLGGETRPKPLGTVKHSRMEKRLTRLLDQFYGERRVQFELSVIIGEDVIIPDVVVLVNENPAMRRDVLIEPPLLCVEVLSQPQRAADMLAKCERYREFGVPFCWIVDPAARMAWEYHRAQSKPCAVTEMFSAPCHLRLRDVFAD